MDWPIGQPGYWSFEFSKNESEDQMGSSASGVRFTKSSNQSILKSSGRDPEEEQHIRAFQNRFCLERFFICSGVLRRTSGGLPEASGGFPEGFRRFRRTIEKTPEHFKFIPSGKVSNVLRRLPEVPEEDKNNSGSTVKKLQRFTPEHNFCYSGMLQRLSGGSGVPLYIICGVATLAHFRMGFG